MLRVGINARFLTQNITGVQRYARELSGALAKTGKSKIKPVLIAPPGHLNAPPENLEIIQENGLAHGYIWEQFKLPGLVKRLKCDLLWSPCNVGPIYSPVPQILTIHDASVFAGPSWFSWWYGLTYKTLLKVLGKRVKIVLTDSQFSKKELIKYKVADERKIKTVLCGVSTKLLDTGPGKKDEKYDPYLLTLGSRDPRKNLKLLIEAWKSIGMSEKLGRKLIVAGGMSKIFSSENINEIPKDIIMKGYVEDEDLPGLYAGAEAFIFSSIYEGFGLPPLEAMACGCPVICSHEASLPEVCGDAAYYIDPYDIESISKGIIKILADDDLRTDMAKKGLEQAKNFDWEKSAAQLIDIFYKAVPGKNLE
jgi:glycosyltransferase involved in cell wall biosynthesis